jgi:hypothetical protein
MQAQFLISMTAKRHFGTKLMLARRAQIKVQ